MRRVALVTGGARGIGRGVALHLAESGWDVAIAYRTSAAAAEETTRQLEARGARALAVAADVGNATTAGALVARVNAELGAPAALVHAAGPYHRRSILEETPAGWRDMFAGNLDSFFYCVRLVAPAMVARRWGRIVGYSMANADRPGGFPGLAAHHAAKVGVLVLARSFARALAPHGITVNAVSPGYIDSGGDDPAVLEQALPSIPAGRLGTIDDAVAATMFLLSDEASYVTGTSLIVSGGWGI